MMPQGLPPNAQFAAEATPAQQGQVDPNEQRRRMMLAQLLQGGGGAGGSPWASLNPAIMQLAQAFAPDSQTALATVKAPIA